MSFVVSIADPIKSINKIASKIGIKEKTIRKAVHILDVTRDAGIIAGKNPEIMAAGISTVSIRKRILDFKKNLNLFL